MGAAIIGIISAVLSTPQGQQLAGNAINGATQLANNVVGGSNSSSGLSNLLANPTEAIKGLIGIG